MTRSRARVGWYVHHQGAGHTNRFLAISRQLDADVVIFSSAPRPFELAPDVEWVLLARDDSVETDARGRSDPRLNDPSARGLLHWAPLRHRGHASRLASIAHRVESDHFDAFVVDVSAEVALLVRLLGVPTVIVAQPGERTDRAHRLAVDAAEAIVAPWPGALYRPAWLERAGESVRYVGGVARFEGRERSFLPAPNTVLLIAGAGGSAVNPEAVAAAVAATPQFDWQTLGLPDSPHPVDIARQTPESTVAQHAHDPAWLTDPYDTLCRATVVVSWAGQNAITDLAAVTARAVVIAQPRPFHEQSTTARILARTHLAVARPHWPATEEWPELLAEAARLEPDWSLWQIDGAAYRAARVIEEVAAA
ncbi:hypothetical protein [Subtercola lobariae]|uniref:Glycosyl transferase family 28 C-terminal domain-containing protein n=1 Tax=Subtercola lobariae TaxID=1588641 RepID=A0A917F3G2_9MICO|nr:hypothetical protein [Subtercola lobariae]GGF41334.1 hypothetical protein GCM10011399_37530 [Subtercola lobariae]